MEGFCEDNNEYLAAAGCMLLQIAVEMSGRCLTAVSASINSTEERKFLTLTGLELRPLCRSAHRQSLYD
jgi:hypothetical protein